MDPTIQGPNVEYEARQQLTIMYNGHKPLNITRQRQYEENMNS